MSEYQFEPYQKVLVRDDECSKWEVSFFGYITDDEHYKYRCVGSSWAYCIPYEGNEHLLNTDTNPEPRFRPRKGQLVAVKDSENEHYVVRKFSHFSNDFYWCVQPCNDENKTDIKQPWFYCEPLKNHFDLGE